MGPGGIPPGPAGNSEATRKAEPLSAVQFGPWSDLASTIAELDSAFFPALSSCPGGSSVPGATHSGSACAFRLLSADRPFCLRGLLHAPFPFVPLHPPLLS